MPHRQGILPVVPPLSQPVHRPAPGVTDAQHPGHLVEALPGGIVPGAPQHSHLGVGPHIHNGGGPPGDAQAHKGRLQIRMGDVVGGDVPPHVVNGNQRQSQRQSRPLGEVDPHQHRPDKPRRIGDGHSVQLAFRQPRISHSPFRQPGNCLHMLPGGNLGHHPAVDGVHLNLRGHAAGQHRPPVPHHGGGGVVAGGFNG